MVTDVANSLVNTDLPVPSYDAISKIPATGPGTPHTLDSLTHTNCYMDDVISVVQGGPDCQHRVFEGIECTLKWLFLLSPGELKNLVSMKKIVAVEGDQTYIKEVLVWILGTEAGTATLPEMKIKEIFTLLDIPYTQRRMGRKDLEHLVGKLCSMHLTVPGEVAHLFHIQCDLNQGGVYQAWISTALNRELADWKALALQAASRPKHLAEIFCRESTDLGFCEVTRLGARGMWIDLARTGHNLA